MTLYEILTIVVALAGVAVSFISLRKSRHVDGQQRRLQLKQEELMDLQLQLLRDKVGQQSKDHDTPTADVRVTLEGFHGRERFVIANWGQGPAKEVDVKIQPRPGRSSPLVQGDYEEKLPIPELLPGDAVKLFAAITFGTGTEFDAILSWTEPDGSRQSRECQVSVP